VVGEQAVEITQLAAIAIAAQTPVDELARVAVSFPTCAEIPFTRRFEQPSSSGKQSNCA
jgi:hypothetical protein